MRFSLGAWKVHRRCAEGAQKVCGRCVGGVWKVSIATIDLVGDNREFEV